ncbi:MAG: HNH endonuclease, partial [Candidatus Dormibacteria bacterium]
MEQRRGEPDNDLATRLGRQAARINAATADLVDMAREFDDEGAWNGVGMRSCAHWLTINIGTDLRTSTEMLRVGHALEQLPLLKQAFSDGRLSFDKVRAVTKVATPADEQMWLHVALYASGAQLWRLCRRVRQALDVAERDASDADQARRKVV